MTRLLSGLLALGMGSLTYAGPITELIVNSQTGDFVGGGQNYSYVAGAGLFFHMYSYSAEGDGIADSVVINFNETVGSDDFWSLQFDTKTNMPFVPGLYANALGGGAAIAGTPA